MTINTQILCDSCGENRVIDSPYPAKYTLELSCKNTGINTSGHTFACLITPPLKGTLHFCGFVCLKNWLGDSLK